MTDPTPTRDEAVPTGWKLVPVVPTLEMQKAYFDEIDRNMSRVETDCTFGRFDNHRVAYAKMLASAPAPASGGVDAVALPDDLFSHQAAWRAALVLARDSAPPAREDFDDRAYWQHELDVFDRVYASLSPAATSGVDAGRVTLFSALEAAYIRGAAWCAEMGMTHTFAELRKAAYDYADKEEKDVICREVSASLSPAATPVEAGGEIERLAKELGCEADAATVFREALKLARQTAAGLVDAPRIPTCGPIAPMNEQPDAERYGSEFPGEPATVGDLFKPTPAKPASSPAGGDVVREALEEAEETLALVEHPAFEDPLYGDEVRALGERIGYGALMSSASASWRKKLEANGYSGGEFVAGPCLATVANALAKIRAALSQSTSGGRGE